MNGPSPFATLEKLAPYNLDAEQELLGAILVNNEALERCDALKVEHFFNQAHRDIFEAILALRGRGETANPVTLKHYFEQHQLLDQIGGPKYLARLAVAATTVVNAGAYAAIVIELAVRRGLLEWAAQLEAHAGAPNPAEAIEELLERARTGLEGIAEGASTQVELISLGEASEAAARQVGAAIDGGSVGIATQIPALDAILAGLEAENLYILAGRPSMGKSALALEIAVRVAEAGEPVLFFPLEMSAQQNAIRFLASRAGFAYDLMRRGRIHKQDYESIVFPEARNAAALPLDFATRGNPSIAEMRGTARAFRYRRKRVGLIVVDYLQLVRPDQVYRGNRTSEVTEISKALKGMAKEFRCPVIALAQLSRAVEQRDDKRPQLSDLRESGAIEQDADAVLFVFREDYYEARKEPREGTPEHLAWTEKMEAIRHQMEIIVPKQRQGPIGTAWVRFLPALNKFEDLPSQSGGME